jgi:hypothetical protein
MRGEGEKDFRSFISVLSSDAHCVVAQWGGCWGLGAGDWANSEHSAIQHRNSDVEITETETLINSELFSSFPVLFPLPMKYQ